ncbi:hypothetical protein [Natronorubrum halophilum]|uniref:hypothetical protein n=1 Tax=Natronorubrum halophilum TaxID=1702106 RepID=UPI0030B80970
MQAVSTFGSALKSTTVERSYPTHQGHPPAIKLGHELHIPDEFKGLDTGIRIEVPPTLSNIFVVTPLAYYLGAKVVPGPEPQLVTKSEFTYNLEGKEDFETTVERILKQIFFLDCIVRTEGATPLPLHEEQVVKSKLDIDFKSLYNKPLASQIRHYLSISFDTVEEHLPDWRLEVKLSPTREIIEFLPFIANRLAMVTVHSGNGTSRLDVQNRAEAIEGFTRHDPEHIDGTNQCEDTASNCRVQISAPTIKQSWSRDVSANITSTTPLAAFYNGLGRIPREGAIEITVICNDQNMKEELTAVNNVYGNREELSFDVSVHYAVTKKDLEEILSQESDFVHYIGHIDQDGMQCTDGKLNAASIETVGAKAFLLNACESHKQGLHLVEAGSLGGIVTLGDIVNNGAIRVGSMIAKLLNQGFPLYAALDLTKKQNITGEQYQIVGNGITTIAQSKTGAPNVCIVAQKKEGVTIRMKTYMAAGTEKGSLFTPYIESVEKYYIHPGVTGEIPITYTHLKEFFDLRKIPVITNGSVEWSDNINASDFY